MILLRSPSNAQMQDLYELFTPQENQDSLLCTVEDGIEKKVKCSSLYTLTIGISREVKGEKKKPRI